MYRMLCPESCIRPLFVYIYPLGGEEIVIILFVSQLIMSHTSVFVALHSVHPLYTEESIGH